MLSSSSMRLLLFLVILMACFVVMGSAKAADSQMNLKISKSLSAINATPELHSDQKDNTQHKPKEQTDSFIDSAYGGLTISLQKNLNLVYTPSSVSSIPLRGEKQGFYLLSNRGSYANWFCGIESNSYITAINTRQTANSVQFGMMMNLE